MAVSLTKPQEEQFEHLKQQYANKGFVVTKVDDLINWARTGSLHWLTTRLGAVPLTLWRVQSRGAAGWPTGSQSVPEARDSRPFGVHGEFTVPR